jgi:hypothetical protein
MTLMIRRRRRNAKANLAFIQQTQRGNQLGNNGGSPPFPPQYPPQAYNSSPYVYDPATGFAPVRILYSPSLRSLDPRVRIYHISPLPLRRITRRHPAHLRFRLGTTRVVRWLDECRSYLFMSALGPRMGSLCYLACDSCCLQTINKVFCTVL